jgi:hypothetical protein
MIATIILGIFAVLFAFAANYKKTQWGLKISFTLIFIFLALRYNFGNDYRIYLSGFLSMNSEESIDLYFWGLYYEPGWIILNRLFNSLGFFLLIAALALFNCVAYYYFITKYVPVKYYWLAVFIYIFYPEFMLIHASAMRQSIAIIFFLFSFKYIYMKNAIRYVLCIAAASLFHVSVLSLLPIYVLGLLSHRTYRVIGLIFISFYVFLINSAQSLSEIVYFLVNTYFPKYSGFNEAGSVDSGFGLLYFGLMSVLTLFYTKRDESETELIFIISIISTMIIPLNFLIGTIGRMGMYFFPATIISYSVIPARMKDGGIKNIFGRAVFISIIIVATSYRFIQFFNSETYKGSYTFYQTIFSAPQWF